MMRFPSSRFDKDWEIVIDSDTTVKQWSDDLGVIHAVPKTEDYVFKLLYRGRLVFGMTSKPEGHEFFGEKCKLFWCEEGDEKTYLEKLLYVANRKEVISMSDTNPQTPDQPEDPNASQPQPQSEQPEPQDDGPKDDQPERDQY